MFETLKGFPPIVKFIPVPLHNRSDINTDLLFLLSSCPGTRAPDSSSPRLTTPTSVQVSGCPPEAPADRAPFHPDPLTDVLQWWRCADRPFVRSPFVPRAFRLPIQ
jgi:hypothetical protein